MTFAYLAPAGRSGYLQDTDLYKLSPNNSSRNLFPKFQSMSKLNLVHRSMKVSFRFVSTRV